MNIRLHVAIVLFLALSLPSFSKEKAKSDLSRFAWNNITIQLPFAPEWAVQKPRKNPYDPLNFMNPNSPPPRIIANLSQTRFELSTKDFSAFQKEFLKSKKAWVQKSGGSLIQEPNLIFDEKEQLLRYEFSFEVPQGKFKEFGHFQRCSPEISFSLRVMIPEAKFQSNKDLTTKIKDFFHNSSACIH